MTAPPSQQAQTPDQAQSSSDNAADLPTFAPGTFEFVTDLAGVSSRPWHVRAGGADKVFKFRQHRGRAPLTSAGAPVPIKGAEALEAAQSTVD